MTHPIITAYAKYDELAFKSTGVGDRIVQAFDKLDLVSELMASESIPIFSVGFFMGANCQVMFVWLWPLKERCIEDVKFWVDNQCYEYDFLRKMYTPQFSVRKSYDVMERDALW